MSFEDFMKLFEGHIAGTAENDREAHESQEEEEEKGTKSKKGNTRSMKGSALREGISEKDGDSGSIGVLSKK